MAHLKDVVKIGENDHGYWFGVGELEGRWLGFAVGLSDEGSMMFTLPEVCDGVNMGMTDRERAIRVTGAVAQERDRGYGGIERWFVPEKLRGTSEDLMGYCEEHDEWEFDEHSDTVH